MSKGRFGEPWGEENVAILDSRGWLMMMNADTMPRIIACVNALDGIEDPQAFVLAAKDVSLTAFPCRSCGKIYQSCLKRLRAQIQEL